LPHLEADHPACGVIDQVERHLAGFDQLGEVRCVRAGDRVDVHAGRNRALTPDSCAGAVRSCAGIRFALDAAHHCRPEPTGKHRSLAE